MGGLQARILEWVACPPPEDLPNLGIEPSSPALQMGSLPSVLKFMCIELVILSNHLILCYPLLIMPSIVQKFRAFFSELALRIRCQGTVVSTSATVLPTNIQDWFPLGLVTDSISLQSKGLSRVFSITTTQKHQFFSLSLLYGLTDIHT